jgi:hypothetical protein
MNLLQIAVRSKFALTSRTTASDQARREMERTLAVADRLGAVPSAATVRVPPMAGIDPEMREWSVFMILEHNTIVNREITNIVRGLATGEDVHPEIDMKTDVLPSADAGMEQVEAFRTSVLDHLDTIPKLPSLRGTDRLRHPVFADLDAHGWHCMFAFHLLLHRRQAEMVAKLLQKTR